MRTISNRAVAESSEGMLDLRRKTLREVLRGRMNFLDRRITLIEQRRNLLFGGTDKRSVADGGSSTRETRSETDREQQEEDPYSVELADSVEVEANSPTQEQLRMANLVAEEYSDAETVVLSEEGEIQVNGVPDGDFTVDASEVLEHGLEGSREPETVPASTPTMDKAAGSKQSGW